ncbi:MAG: radical SAM protein [Methanocella sp.]
MTIWAYFRGSEILDIKVGYHCNNRCIHCVVEPVRQKIVDIKEKQDLSTQEIKDLMSYAKDLGLKTVVLTGGEVTIREDFKEIVAFAVEKQLKVLIQTNGRGLSSKDCRSFLESVPSLTFILAIHSSEPKIHDAITQVEGSFEETARALETLSSLHHEVIAKTVISKLNCQNLFETVRYAKKAGAKEMSIVFPHALDFSREQFEAVIPRYSLLADQIAKIATFSEAENYLVDFETIPFCICSEPAFWYRNCDLISKFAFQKSALADNSALEASQSYDGLTTNQDANGQEGGKVALFDWEVIRPNMKEKSAQCKCCVFDKVCEGPWKEYVNAFGFSEFIPLKPEEVTSVLP